MRVLFFVEPFPVRGRPLDFQWVVSRWLALSQQLARLGATPLFAVSDAVKAARPDAAPWLVSPSDLGVNPALPEEPDRLDAEWVRLMTEPDHPLWRPFVDALLEHTRPDAVVTWTVNAPLRAATAERGLVLMHQEAGPMRPPNPMMYFADPQGVNGASSLPDVWPTVREQPLTREQEQELEWLRTEALAPSPLSREEISRRLELVPGRRVLAVFLQVPRDSNTLMWSRLRGGELTKLVTEATSPGLHHVLVRPHPLHPLPPGGTASHVRVVTDLPAEALLEVADAVLTINSSVGLEALARGKVVYTFGESPYAGRGCTRDLGHEPEELRQALASGQPFTLTPEEERLRLRLVHFLVFRYLMPEGEASSPEALLGRLERWKRLRERGAPRHEWFAPEPAGARLGLMRAETLAAGRAARCEHVSAELATMRAEREETRARLDAARAEAEALRQRLDATSRELQARLGAAQAEANALRQQLGAAQAEANALRQQLGAAQTEANTLHQRLDATTEELEHLRHSLGQRMLDLARRVPGIYPGYLLGKRLLHGH